MTKLNKITLAIVSVIIVLLISVISIHSYSERNLTIDELLAMTPDESKTHLGEIIDFNQSSSKMHLEMHIKNIVALSTTYFNLGLPVYVDIMGMDHINLYDNQDLKLINEPLHLTFRSINKSNDNANLFYNFYDSRNLNEKNIENYVDNQLNNL